MNAIKKCIIPVAGFGTRFLPATKANVDFDLERPDLGKDFKNYLKEKIKG